jgi:hypothetical protein
MSTIPTLHPESKPLTCTEALDQAYNLALARLPESTHPRLAKGLVLVQHGSVFETDGHRWEVLSQSEPGKIYSVNGSCQCRWSKYNPNGNCAHQYAVLLQRKALQLLQAPQAETPPGAPQEEASTPAVEHHEPVQTSKRQIPAHYVQQLQGKPFIKYMGLLQMAHEDGLTSLTEAWTYNDPELSLAHAVATFADGRVFAGSGDSTPQNARNIGLAWRRMALTRSKARALRDALGIDMAAVEEMD